MVDTTGIRSSASSRSRIAGFTARTSPTKPSDGSRGFGLDEPGVLARHADGERAVHVDGGHDLAVDLADEHHPGDVERLGVGDPLAVAELGLLAQPLHQVADLRAAAVHDHRPEADRVHQHDVLGERGRQRRVDHGVAAVLHDDHPTPEPLDVRQRLDEHGRPLLGFCRGGHDVPMFSST